jgi:hypothetical protein
MGLYESKSHIDLETQFKSLISKLHLNATPNYPNIYYSTDKQSSLSLEPIQGYAYYFNNDNVATDSTQVDKNTAIQVGFDFLNKLGFSASDFTLNPNSVQHYSSRNGELETNALGPIIGLNFTRTLASLPVTIGGSTLDSVEFYISSAGVFKARFPALAFSYSQVSSAPHVSVEQLKQNIALGEYKIMGTPIETKTQLPVFGAFSSVVLRVKSFEYRVDEQQNLIIPFIHFIGTGIPVGSQNSADLELITPIVATQ